MYVNIQQVNPPRPTYLGEEHVDLTTHPVYSKYTPSDWAMLWIERYGQIDGEHHKTWVIDQVARILKGTRVTAKLARWDDGQKEMRFDLEDVPSPEYHVWVDKMLGGTDEEGEREYSYDVGIPP